MENTKKVNWVPVIIYYLLACIISWPFFWWRDIHNESFVSWNVPGIFKTWTYMLGPGISVLIVTYIIYKGKLNMTSVTLFGGAVLQSLLFWFLPFLMLAIPGIPNQMGMNPHLFPILFMGLLGFISIIGEDSGWSYFMKNMLIKIPSIPRSIIVGALWELWHFTNRTANRPFMGALISVLLMMAIVIVLYWIMSMITDRTKSLVTAVTIHMWMNVLTENGSPAVYIVFGISTCLWAFLLITWNKPFWKAGRRIK